MDNFLVNFSKHLQGLARDPFVTDARDRQYRLEGYTPIEDPAPKPLRVETLSAIKAYLEQVPDPNDADTLFLQIEDYRTVSLKTTFNGANFCERRTLLIAQTPDLAEDNGVFERGMEQSQFIIALHTLFAESHTPFCGKGDDDRSYLLRVASRITAQTSAELADNGLSQDTTLKAQTRGNLSQDETIRPIVALKPYRSFREMPPVEGLFNFRLESKKESLPGLKLICADGGAWKLDTINAIKGHLTDTLGITIPILA